MQKKASAKTKREQRHFEQSARREEKARVALKKVVGPRTDHERPITATSSSWRLTWRPAVSFAIASGVSILPFGAFTLWQQVNTARADIEIISREAAVKLDRAAQYTEEYNFAQAVHAYTTAAADFREARTQLISVNEVLTPLLRILPSKGNPFTSAENLLIAGEQLAAAGADVTTAFALFDRVTAEDEVVPTSTDLLMAMHSAFRPVVPRLERAALALDDVDLATIPPSYREDIALAKEHVPRIQRSMEELLNLTETLLVLLGHEKPKRYLILFQNNREIRATGGFIGSFAVVDIDQGEVKAINIPGGGPYDLLGSLNVKVISPQPLHLVNPHWQMQDANWWPDFPTSAKKIQWFYRKSGGSTVDGVITLTPDIIQEMLAITGPIPMPEYDVVITRENFYRITQTEAERKFDETRESKKFIAELTPRLLDRLFTLTADTALPVLDVVYRGLLEKDILLSMNDEFLEKELSALGWTGEVKQTTGDYLMVVDTNISGGKTDAAITETIEHEADIQDDGSIIDTVTITRTHHGQSDDAFEDMNNVDYIRLYVPLGSELISAEGFNEPDPALFFEIGKGYSVDADLQAITGEVLIDEQTKTRINDEFGKTVFGNWLQTQPGKTSRATIRYTLPFIINPEGFLNAADEYSLLIQKQPGSFDPLLITKLFFPEHFKARWAYPNTSAQVHQPLTRDAVVGIVFERK